MGAAIGRTVVTVTLALLFPLAAGAATPWLPDLDMCRAQKQKDCRRLSVAELDRMRGGMLLMTSIGPIEVTFGITQAIYINNKLVAVTQLVMTPIANIPTPSLSQMQAANAALQSAPAGSQASSTSTGNGAPAGPAPSAARGATSATPAVTAAPTSVAPTQTAGLNGTLNAAPRGAGAPTQTSASNPRAVANTLSAAPAASVSPTVLVNGSVVTPGSPVINVPSADDLRLVIVQNGAGNIALPSAADIAAGVATIVQNTANNQVIRAVTEMNVSMALTKAMSAASISNAVRQGMVTSRP